MVFRFSGYWASSMVNTLTLYLCIKSISCLGLILFFSSKILEDIFEIFLLILPARQYRLNQSIQVIYKIFLDLCPLFYSRPASILMNYFSSDVPPIFFIYKLHGLS